ncbi:MAG: hypothetical protein IPO30_02650 [Hyphomonadaceae bacterium]|nr:hypothetical protein [Hyphomonadaceae bacterium]
MQYAEDGLGQHPWVGGAEFSAADIMMVFPLNFAMQLNIVDKNQFPKINEWKARIEAGPAYQAMLAKARPDGMIGSPPLLPKPPPQGRAPNSLQRRNQSPAAAPFKPAPATPASPPAKLQLRQPTPPVTPPQ